MADRYELKFTPIARALAAKYGLGTVEEQIRGEIAELVNDGLSHPGALGFHTVRMRGGSDYEFIVTPKTDAMLVVDGISFDDSETLDAGPFEGFRVQFPTPASDD